MSQPKPTHGEAQVKEFLAKLNLAQYLDRFVSEGFDQLPSLQEVTEEDLAAMEVKRGHRRLIQREIATGKGIPLTSPLTINLPYREAESGGTSSRVGGSTSSSSGNGQQSSMTGRDTSISMNSSGGTSSTHNSSISSTEDDNGVSDTSMADHPNKRKYRRHAKPDKNAPLKPPSAYVMFSNSVRAELKSQNISFTDIAKIVGDRWKSISPQEKEDYEMTAARAKEAYLDSLSRYEQTQDYKAYQQYMSEFKAKQEAAGRTCGKTRKRVKSDSPGSGSGNGQSPPISHGLKDHSSSAFSAFDPTYKSSSSYHHHQQLYSFHPTHSTSSRSSHSHLPPHHFANFHHHSSSQSYPSPHQYYSSSSSPAPPVVASASSQSDSTSSNSSSSQIQSTTSENGGNRSSRSPLSPMQLQNDSPPQQQQLSPSATLGEAPPSNSPEDAR